MATGNKKQVILFLGLPGSGKTTQSTLLTEAYNFYHLTTSRIIRDKFRNIPYGQDPDIDKERIRYDAGKIVDPEFVARWVNESIRRAVSKSDGIILDGSPRSRSEAESLMPTLTVLFGKSNILPIHLNISSDTARERISTRFICVQCEKTYPREIYIKTQICDDSSCEGALAQKPLDKPEIFEERLKVFTENTEGALDFFASKKILLPVDGEPAPNQVFKDILKLFH